MSSKNYVDVIIDGKIYNIGGFESEAYLQKVATYINNMIQDFKQNESYRMQNMDMQRILLEINIANDYFKAKKQADMLEGDLELKEKEMKSLEDYKETYGSDAYGLTAYILHKLQIYSIPFCFLGIMVGGIYNYVLGIRHLEIQEKGLALMVSFVTLAIICQVLPLVFTIVVKFGRE